MPASQTALHQAHAARAVAPAIMFAAARALPRPRRIDLILAGARGQVGSAFRRQLQQQCEALRATAGIELALVAAFDRRGLAFDLQGLSLAGLEDGLQPRQAGDAEQLFAHVCRPGAEPTLLVDCTASDAIADLYLGLLAAGVGVVGANKRANSRSLAVYRRLQATAQAFAAPYRYETTVGAAIPLLGPVRDLRLRGETVHSVRGVLSGSLSYILHRLHQDCALSAAVAEARALGYTEPDPMEDLQATDLLRKLLVLGREAGFPLEPETLSIESLLQTGGGPTVTALEQVASLDESWRGKIAEARREGQRWVLLAEADADGGRITLQRVPEHSAFGRLLPGQNLVELRTQLQDQTPLSFCGPGAGAEVTAAGVLSDVIAAATQLAQRQPARPG